VKDLSQYQFFKYIDIASGNNVYFASSDSYDVCGNLSDDGLHVIIYQWDSQVPIIDCGVQKKIDFRPQLCKVNAE